MQATFEPNEPITLTMPAGEWQLIMQLIATASGGLIAKLQQQALEAKGIAPPSMPVPNGEIRDASRV